MNSLNNIVKIQLSGDAQMLQVFWQVRVVRVVALVLAACGMSISGLIMQQLAQNKFAAPTTGTTIDGAKFGVMLSMILFPARSLFTEVTMAFLFAMLSTGLFLFFINRIKIKNVIFVPLVGLMLGNVIDSFTTFLSYQTDQVQNINSWLQANLATLLKGNYEILYFVVPMVIIAYLYANQFTIVGMGESFSTSLGLNHQRIMNLGLMIISIITASVIISVGSIPFLGLIIPNIVSMLYGDKLQNNLVETSLLGSIFILLCDIFGRVIIFPYEIPLTLTVGIIGCAIFLFMIFKNVRRGKGGTGNYQKQKANE